MLIEKSCLQKNCLEGKTVLVTGGGGGIAAEMARALVWLGADVILAEVDEEKGRAASALVNGESGSEKAHFYEIDLTSAEQIDGLHTYILERFGFLDVIFNNATVAERRLAGTQCV